MSILLYPNDHVSGVFEICDVIIISLEAFNFNAQRGELRKARGCVMLGMGRSERYS
jgi:hypothetical protein